MNPPTAGRRVTRFAKLLVDAWWWLVVLGSALAVVLALLWPVFAGRAAWSPTVEARVSIADKAAPRFLPLSSPDSMVAASPALKDVAATLQYRTADWWLIVLGWVVELPALAALLLGLWLMRSFLRDVVAEKVFTATNARRLSRLGWLMVVTGVLWPILTFVYALFAVRHGHLSGVPVQVNGIRSVGTVLPGLLLLVVGAAWRHGVELQRDHDLTV